MDLSFIGEQLKAARIEKRLTLEKLSEKIGISRNFLWEIEAGRKAPAIQTLFNLSKELNISIDYLFGLSNDKKWLETKNQDDIALNINRIITKLNNDELNTLYILLKGYFENKNHR